MPRNPLELRSPPDILILGAGAAGLALARALHPALHIAVVAPDGGRRCASRMALGGIAAALDARDDPALHASDTERCGAFAGSPDIIRALCAEAPEVLRDLERDGMVFDRSGKRLDLAQEAGHRQRRIAHVGDRTGDALMAFLDDDLRRHPNVTRFGGLRAITLLTDPTGTSCLGARLADSARARTLDLRARATVLACGGCSAIYPHFTGPEHALGDGLRIAHRASVPLRDLAFIQFHPTALPHPQGVTLLTEALRGEGATLLNTDGRPLMDHHPDGDLAPRDVVARAVHQHLLTRGTPAQLDLRPLRHNRPQERFPSAWNAITRAGHDPHALPVPVVAAAHYTCGGIAIDGSGRTAMPGLYASGEVACSGLHGANRLASNSLMEALVLAPRTAEALRQDLAHTPRAPRPTRAEAPHGTPADTRTTARARAILHRVRSLAGDALALARNARDLQRALHELRSLQRESERLAERWPTAPAILDACAASTSAALIASDAASRLHSLGTHHRTDDPTAPLSEYPAQPT